MTRRNNADRVGAPHPDAPDIPDTLEVEPGPDPLAFIVPTEFVTLPSKGVYYPESHPLHAEDAVEIKFMTAKEEDLLTSQSLIEKGIVLDRLIDSLLVNKKIRSRDLLICERSAILVRARASGYGTDYSTTITCRNCGTKDKSSYDLTTAVYQGPLSDEELSETSVKHLGAGHFEVNVPDSPVHLVFRLLNGHDERGIMDLTEKRKKKKQEARLVTDQLNFMIVSVLDHEDREIVNRYVDSLPLRDSRYLRQVYEAVSPSVTLRKEFVCDHCDHEDDITFPFTTDFFWPDI